MKKSANTGGQQTPQKRKPPRTAWKPGQSGNPGGRPVGSKHRATILAENLIDGQAQKLAQKAVDMALRGDVAALRLCLERLVPPRKERSVSFDLPKVETAADVLAAKSAVIEAVASGLLAPLEAQAMSTLLDGVSRTLEAQQFEERLAALEAKAERGGKT